MDYELITSRVNVRLVLTNVRPVYHFYLLYKKFISHYLLLFVNVFIPSKVSNMVIRSSIDCLTIFLVSLSRVTILYMYDIYIISTCTYYINNVFIFTKPIDNNFQVVRINILLFRHSRNNLILCMVVCGFGRVLRGMSWWG